MGRAAVLAGVGSAVPDRVVTNDMYAARMDTTDEWIRTRTGIRERRHLERGSATSDLAAEAGRRALKSAGVGAVDAVVLATTTPDHPCPATAPTVAAALGLGTVPAYDVGAVCSGFLYALASGAGLIALGTAERVLVIGAEAFTTIIDQSDRGTAPIFGDGAGAVVLSAGDQSQPGALLAFDLGSDGDLADLIIIPGGGSRQRASGLPAAPGDEYMAMHGREVFRHAVLRMTESSRTVLARTGWDVGSLDWLVGHQANVRILRAVADHLGLAQERAFVNVDRYGNTAAASIPLALDDAATTGLITPGDRIVLTAFGGGATWGAIALEWPNLAVA
ncbi:beta-ketoacyl-ACP synthase III [Actinokineospora globicatena]|uniref:beta-ketoacyl-ACP synthase III n=1 Tax=Actinokineospora globicatena TaxID=103729 RepID=UPI0020A418DC|nr:beta-ketoacyl-ACP synthase III [Actinokineospora globicatena]MCP2306035.1 3-oxoacyl-[acyl-carrier-protein] synthase III (EC 2.3.1.41) [Actinokineospora globicatena]GLW80092.1 3-oxoacyl-[acyl-carrier-protein] synthase 3 [Actinokineospora globicatena]GLW86921.1 3-oxoacyl-[acyl-carrier-protein] synthase 3 [Actinokineospora globicatena]